VKGPYFCKYVMYIFRLEWFVWFC